MWDQLVVGAAPGDAITQSALLLRKALLGLGPSELYAQHVEPGLDEVVRPLDDLPSRPNRDRPLVFHASMGSWPVHRSIMDNEQRLVLVYHNFSPPEPFVDFAPEVASDLIRGRWELEVVRDRVEVAIADSDFNAAELSDLGYSGVQVIPPTPDIDRLSRLQPDPDMARKIRKWGSGPLVLCVAQQLPHKRIEHVVAAVAVLQQEYHPTARLAFVGVDRFPTYTRSLNVLADAVGLAFPQMLGRVSDGELAALYSAADVFLTLSDHEGFCIPAVEAMAVGVPVVASSRAAIPSTVGDAGILIDTTDDPTFVAGVLDEVLTNPELRTEMVGRGTRRAHELSAAVSLPQLFRAVTGFDPIVRGTFGRDVVRISFVVQRYGDSFVGGAEKYVLSMATGLSAEGHDVSVVTSCATSYANWADVYEPGTTVEHGVTIHRLPVVAPRDNERFNPLHQRAIQVRDIPLWPWGQDRWSELIGPDLTDPGDHLVDLAAASDATFVVGYHYSQTLRLTKILSAHGPTAVVPTAHPEGAFHVGYVRQMFDHADRILCLAPEEADLVSGVYGHRDRIRYVPCPVIPIDRPAEDVIESAVARYGVDRDRYAVVVGRIDPGKGSDDLIRFTDWYRRSVDPSFELVVIGPGESKVADGVHLTGFVDEPTKNALIAGSGLLIQPSYMESFSFALIEGWLFDRPALVQERSRVLAGHVARSGGGLAYHDYFSFEAALATVREEHSMAADLGRRGGRYARTEFSWDSVRERFLSVVDELM